MNWTGLLIGTASFIMIGLFHPAVKILEYHIGKKGWWIFFVCGITFTILSFHTNNIWSMLLGTVGFGCFWSTHEMFLQHKRVLKGRAKMNPKRTYS